MKAAAALPVIANGDIDSPQKAAEVLQFTGADAVMIGRGAQGRPWIFREIAHYLATGELLPAPAAAEVAAILLAHVVALHAFYGELQGVRIARKHLAWYCQNHPHSQPFREQVNRAECASRQLAMIHAHFDALAAQHECLPSRAA